MEVGVVKMRERERVYKRDNNDLIFTFRHVEGKSESGAGVRQIQKLLR